MAELVSSPQTYTNSEREIYNLKCHGTAENSRARNDHLLEEAYRLIKDAKANTENTQSDVSKKLDQRLGDLSYWNDELKNQHTAISQEIHLMEAVRNRLDKALNRIADPISTTQKCLEHRNDRVGIDLVHDDVQKELYKESDVIIGAKGLLYKTLENVVEQLRLNKKIKYELELNITKKEDAIAIDSLCQIPTNCLSNQSLKLRVRQPDDHYSVEDWHADCLSCIRSTQNETYSSAQLRLMVTNIISQARSDIQNQINAVNEAFWHSIEETKNAKGKLESELFEVKNQIRQTYKTIECLKNAIQEKEEPLTVAITRMGKRDQRQQVELCRDSAYYKLIEEVNQLRESIGKLGSSCHSLECSERTLIENQRRIEEEISIKENTIFIDEVQCMNLRNDLKVDDY
uniref:Tektin n=1 Tax=Dicyema japonicum TaxID=399803 RepID=A2V6Z5_DICJA|nr:tektin C [Dicyema japonicum]